MSLSTASGLRVEAGRLRNAPRAIRWYSYRRFAMLDVVQLIARGDGKLYREGVGNGRI